MKQKQIGNYRPNYPKKIIRCAALTAAAAVALSGTAGCELRTQGEPLPEPTPTDELVLDGEVGYDDPELRLDGEVAIDETDDPELLLGGEPLPEPTPEQEEGHTRYDTALMGKYVVPEETENP